MEQERMPAANARWMNDRALRVVLIVALSAVINLLYVIHLGLSEQDRQQGDSAYYHLAGKGVEELLRHPFRYGGALIQGTLTQQELADLGLEKSYNGGLLRSPAYGLFLGLLYAGAGDGIRVIAVAQALLVALSVLLLYFLGRALWDHATGLIAAAIAALYSSFIYYTGRVLTEIPTLVLLLATILFAVQTCRHSALRWPVLAGCASGALLLCKISLRYFILLLLVLLILLLRREGRPVLIRRVRAFLLGLAGVLVPWLIFATLVYHAPLLTAPLHTGPLYTLYRGNYVPSDGWEDDGAGDAWTREFIEASDEGAPGDFERGKVYRAAAIKTIRNYPGGFLLLLVKKVFRLWNRPADPWAHSLGIVTLPQQVTWHRLLLMLALLGAVYLAFKRPTVVLLIAPIVYLTLLHAASRIEARFAMPAMPFVILLATATAGWLGVEHRRWLSMLRTRAFQVALLAFVLLLLGAYLTTTAGWLQLWPGLPARSAYLLALLLPFAALVAAGRLLFLLFRQDLGTRAAWVAALAPVAALCVVCGAQAAGDRAWSEWRCRLDSGDRKIVQEFALVGPLELSHFNGAALEIDMQGGLSQDYAVSIKVNGHLVKEYEHGLTVDESSFIYPEVLNPGVHTRLLDALNAALVRARELHPDKTIGLEYFRQWHWIPVDLALLQDVERVNVEISVSGRGGKEDYLEVYGDYAREVDPKERHFTGPSFARTLFETSIDKLASDAGDRRRADFRLQRKERLLSQGVLACLGERGVPQAADLSPAYGRQTGEYRIRLELEGKGTFYRVAGPQGEKVIDWRFESDAAPEAELATADDLRWAQRWTEGLFSGYLVF
jgi:4-amino-4-deoxy-L-arabinose transferase-like glycosyltransferase